MKKFNIDLMYRLWNIMEVRMVNENTDERFNRIINK